MNSHDKTQLSPFMNKIHTVGRISSALAGLSFVLVGVAACIRFGIFPSFGQFLGAIIPIFVFMIPASGVEFLSYLPLLGAGACYISFITGNISNMKIPSLTAALQSIEVEQGSEKFEVLSILASAVASLEVIVLVTLLTLFTGALTPVLEWAPIQPAFTYIMPAIFGLLIAGPLLSFAKATIPALIMGILGAVFIGDQVVVMLMCIGTALLVCFFEIRKRKTTVS